MQRTIRYFYCAVIALLAMSCDKVSDDTPVKNVPIVIPESISAKVPTFETKTQSFQGGGLIEDAPESWDGTETVETRTYAVVDEATRDPNTGEAGEYYQYWSEGDAISLFFTRANLKYVMQGYKGSLDVGEFLIEGEPTEGGAISTGYYYSVYPYKESTSISAKGKVTYEFPKTQHYNSDRGDTYSDDENGMIARARPEEVPTYEKGVLYFQNFCSYLQLRLVAIEDQPTTVKKITLTANDKTVLISGPGQIEVVDAAGEPKVSMNREPDVDMKRQGSNQIVLDCGSGVELSTDPNAPTKFWFVVPGDISFTGGFSVSIIYDDLSYYRKSTQKTIGIQRSHIKPMATLKPEVTQASGPIRYQYNDSTIVEPFPLKNTFYGEGGVTLDIIDQVYDEETGEWVVLLSGTLETIGGNSFEENGPDIEYIKICNDKNPVTIDNFAFYKCSADSIVVYNPVNTVGKSAFSTSTITDINIYGSVESFKEEVSASSVIENIKITGDVGTIENGAFKTLNSIQSVEITGNVGKIETEAFRECPNMHTFGLDGSIDTIEAKAFYNLDQLENLSIEGDVNIVGEQAFYDCDSMDKIHIHGDINRIEDQAFYRCDALESVEIIGHIEYIGEEAFSDCDILKSVDIQNGVNIIGKNAFRDCDELEVVHVDGDIQAIDEHAFFDCDKLQNVDIEGDIATIGQEAFALCDELKSVDIVGNIGNIDTKAFYDCDELQSINIVGDINSISDEAFSLCDTLKDVHIDGDVDTINKSAFAECLLLNSVVIEGSVNTIGKEAFTKCDNLKTFSVESIETIEYRAFYNCENLTEVSIPGVKYLNMGAFRGCTDLQTITLDSVIVINDNVFYDCSSLESIVIPESCTMIGEGAFCGAVSLKEVYCYPVNPPFIKTDNYDSSYVFDSTHDDLVIYIPSGSIDIYLDDEIFEGQTFEDPSIEANVNWWYEEYEDYLVEM